MSNGEKGELRHSLEDHEEGGRGEGRDEFGAGGEAVGGYGRQWCKTGEGGEEQASMNAADEGRRSRTAADFVFLIPHSFLLSSLFDS